MRWDLEKISSKTPLQCSGLNHEVTYIVPQVQCRWKCWHSNLWRDHYSACISNENPVPVGLLAVPIFRQPWWQEQLISSLVECFEPCQVQRIASGLNTNFTLSPSYSCHKSSHHKSCFFLAYLYSAGTQHGNLPPAGWPILFCGPTQEPCVSHSQYRKNREKFWKKCRWMDRKGRNKQGRNPW